MKTLLLFILLTNYMFAALFSDEKRYVNDQYDQNLKIIWLNNKADSKKNNLQSFFGKSLNNTVIKLNEENKFENIETKTEKNYSSIISALEDSIIYISKQKMEDVFNDLFDDNVDNQLVVVMKFVKVSPDNYKIFGLKMFKDGKNSIVSSYEVNKYTKKLTQQIVDNMTYFYILSSIVDYDSINRRGVKPIITSSTDNNLNIEIFKAIEVKKDISFTEEKDYELAHSLGLISNKKVIPKNANEYCNMLGLMLINKSLINDELEYNYEQLFEKIRFQDGWEVYGENAAPNIFDKMNFRCIEAKDTIDKISLNEYELENIGLKAKLNNKNIIHKVEISAVDILDDKTFDGEDSYFVSMIDNNGTISIWENSDNLAIKKTDIISPISIKLSKNFENISIETLTNEVRYKNSNGVLTYNDKNKIFKYINHKGEYIIDSQNDISIGIDKTLKISDQSVSLPYMPTALTTYSNEILVGAKGTIYSYNKTGKLNLKYSNIPGKVTKILNFRNKYFVASTNNSDLIFFKIGESKPIKIISNFGYSFLNLAISQNERFLAAVNGDQVVYIFDIDIIINSTISDINEEK